MKRGILICILALNLVLGLRGFPMASPCLVYNGVDTDGNPASLSWCVASQQPSAQNGIFQLEVTGMIDVDSNDQPYVSDILGSESNGHGIRDVGTAFAVLGQNHLYVFFSQVTDFEIIGQGTAHSAYLYDIEMNNGSFILRGFWTTIYWSPLDLLANDWFWHEPGRTVYLGLY